MDSQDPHAKQLADRLDGQAEMKFANDPNAREFDVVSKDYIGEAKPATTQVNLRIRNQAKAVFEAAHATGRDVYYHFSGGAPRADMIDCLQRYAQRYGVRLVIDDKPF